METVRRICIYETDQKFYVVGSNDAQTRFRVLEVDRSHPTKLIIHDDKVEYQDSEIHEKLNQIDSRIKVTDKQKKPHGVLPSISAYSIIGFVKFLEGFYMILVTKRKRVAVIGGHSIFKIEDTTMIYIPQVKQRDLVSEEPRYLKIFQNINLSSNFYFCYSYDSTHSLQYNLTGCNHQDGPKDKFVWNKFLWKEASKMVSPHWMISIIHGFVGQANVSIFGRSVYVTLIARRSNRYAGTRYLKRGSSALGEVANEVETEQIVYDASLTSFQRGRYTSYLQYRGSVPGMWSQDISSMVPKPPITVNESDPYFHLAARHFNNMFRVYGSPVIILNLVKKHEKRKRESKLTDELHGAVQYLNQFLPPEHSIHYKHLDMAKYNKCPELDVIAKLERIADSVVDATGLFMYGTLMDPARQNPRRDFSRGGKTIYKQTGVVRTNCVDCLDRTNTAQFMVGKQALGHQLFSLGFVSKTHLEFDTDCVRMLSEIYEDMGDTLAVQYGGSQLVHSVNSYRKVSAWKAQSRDITQTVSRYYRNAFSDADKQNAINLFLGVFVPQPDEKLHLWDYETDYYLHHNVEESLQGKNNSERSHSHWFEDKVIQSLPLPYEEVRLESQIEDALTVKADAVFDEYYHPEEFTSLADLFCLSTLPHSISGIGSIFPGGTEVQVVPSITYMPANKDYMPKTTNNISPFTVRINQPQRKEESRQTSIFSLSFSKDSKTSLDLTSSEDDSSSSDESVSELSAIENTQKDITTPVTMKDVFPTMEQTYGVEPKEPSKEDAALYKRFVTLAVTSTSEVKHVKSKSGATVPQSPMTSPTLNRSCNIRDDSVFTVAAPAVDSDSLRVYKAFVERGTLGAVTCQRENYDVYKKYLRRL